MAAGNRDPLTGVYFRLQGLLRYLNYPDKSQVYGPDSIVLQIQYELKELDDRYTCSCGPAECPNLSRF